MSFVKELSRLDRKYAPKSARKIKFLVYVKGRNFLIAW